LFPIKNKLTFLIEASIKFLYHIQDKQDQNNRLKINIYIYIKNFLLAYLLSPVDLWPILLSKHVGEIQRIIQLSKERG
jgi:uncharacterized membrane protein YkvA (DUF1232 family)